MSDIELKKIADNSDMIVNGYSFTKKDVSLVQNIIGTMKNGIYAPVLVSLFLKMKQSKSSLIFLLGNNFI